MNSCSGGSSWTPPLPFLKTLFFLFILISFFVSITSSSYSESTESEHFITPDGKYVYIDDDKVYLKATYHVTHGQAIEHSAMTKQYTGDCDFAIGFDGEVAWPKKVLLDDPHYIYQETENTETFYYVSNFEQTEDTPDYGNSYNSLKYKFDHKVLTDVGDPDGYVWIDVYDTVAYFDSQDSEGNNYTITWDTIHSQFEQYTDVSDRILSNPIEYEFDGKNLWYVTKNIYMTAGEMRNIIIEMESKIEFGENSYKYDIIWKPSHQSISEANAAGNLYILDPYWNTSWNNRISNQLPDGKRPYLYSLNISNDVGTNNATHIFGNGDFNSNYSDIVMAFDDGTIIQHAIEDNSSDPTILWANVTTNGTVHIYFNNSEAVDSSDYSGIVSGGVVSGSNGKIIQSFLSNGSFSPFDSFDVECLVVAGGGGGGTNTGGGGGAGGLLYNVSYAVSLQTYDIKVGAGGVKDDNGGNSVFSTLTAIGGGGGQGGADGLDGGSGGGGGHYATWDGGSGVAGQGHDGGDGVDYNSGGGGGAGQVGDNADSANSGDGGNGLAYSISGSSTYYAGGGGGGADTFRSDNPGSGGLGGGGNGGDSSVGYPGTVNTGGGGGGGSNRPTPMAGGTGGSGIVIIRYDNSGTWSTWSETQYYTDSLHYNATSPYNFTIESDSTLTSNRSIIPADDTNDTALSTGTSYLIINVFDNDATIVRNFTFIGDNLDWYQAANLSGSYDLKNTGGIIETQSNGNFTTNLVAGTYWIEEEVLAVNYSIDKNETITYTDTIYITKTVAAVNYSIDKSDTITLTDSVSLTKTVAAVNYSIDNSDTITITDTISITKTVAAINYSINTSDTITYTDSVFLTKTAASINYTSNVSDTIIFTDSVSLTKTVAAVNYSIDKNDTITISDSITLTKTTASINYSIDKSDTITYTDSVSLTKTTASVLYTTNISDTIAITDSVEFTKTSAPIGYNVSISDTITLTDSVTITKTTAGINYSINISDSITLVDSVVMNKTLASVGYIVNVEDTVSFTDSVSIEKTLASVIYSINTSDTITFIDSISLSKTTAGAINYTVKISDTITINDSVSLTKTSAANNEVFSFTNATIVPSTMALDEPFIVLVDINDTDGTIVEAVVKINTINYTMSNVGGDTWSYIFAEPNFARRYYVTDFYAKDDFGAWNGTTSTLYISATPVVRSGRGITTPTPTPVPTPEIIPIVYPEEPMEFIEVTDYLLNFLSDFIFAEDVFIFKIIFDPNERIITKTFYRDDTFSCIHSPSVTHDCIMDDSNIAVSVDVDTDNLFIRNEVLNDIIYDENSELYVDVKVLIINLMVGLQLMDTDINNPSSSFFTNNVEGKINGIRVLPMLLFATIGGLVLYGSRNIKMTDITYSYYYLDNYLTTKAKTISNKNTWRIWYNDLAAKAKKTRKVLKFKYNYYRRYVRNYIWAFRIRKGL